jgi:hypothetical protein
VRARACVRTAAPAFASWLRRACHCSHARRSLVGSSGDGRQARLWAAVLPAAGSAGCGSGAKGLLPGGATPRPSQVGDGMPLTKAAASSATSHSHEGHLVAPDVGRPVRLADRGSPRACIRGLVWRAGGRRSRLNKPGRVGCSSPAKGPFCTSLFFLVTFAEGSKAGPDQEIPGPANRDPDSRFPAESGIGDSLCPDSRPNRESGERELGISGSGPALRESPVGMVNPWTPKTNCNSRACR